MLTSVLANFENGEIIWVEKPPKVKNTKVVVTFLEEEVFEKEQNLARGFGQFKGKAAIPDNFNDPIEDLKDYM